MAHGKPDLGYTSCPCCHHLTDVEHEDTIVHMLLECDRFKFIRIGPEGLGMEVFREVVGEALDKMEDDLADLRVYLQAHLASNEGAVTLMLGGAIEGINIVNIMEFAEGGVTKKGLQKAKKFANNFMVGRLSVVARFLSRAMTIRNAYAWSS
jgi:hypothetical protein